MRLLNYEVERVDGTIFHTASYKEAKKDGNRIVKSYLTKADEKTEKQKEWDRKHAHKILENLKVKKAEGR